MNKDFLYRYFSGQCSDRERADIRRWVESGPEALETYMRERRFYDTAMCLAPDEAQSAPVRRRTPRMLRWTATVAAAAVVAVVSIFAYRFVAATPSMDSPMQTLVVPPGQRLQLTLADGTSVWLNSQTTMRFPGVFASDSRHVEIDGEAYFQVAKDADRPFTVGTKAGDVRVTGTTFNVDAYRTSPTFSLSLVEGSVSLATPKRTFRLTPGQSLELDTAGTIRAHALNSEQLEWVDGIVSFRNMRMADILSRFEKYYGVTVEIRNQTVAAAQFSGRFYLDEGIVHALNVLQRDIQFSYTQDKDRRHIIIM
ncbi:MAG: FecR domain-containing protein [Muribaculaceae bacterium]|nr:FecR domain-containing protein [Muribaculaceae bacterium]